jgi:D-alanyl-D-alanine carboxypeptidase
MTQLITVRTAVAATLVLSATVSLATPALATPALVVDVDSGRVLFAEQATDPWFPASVTKLMTTYAVLSEIKSGRLSFDSPLPVSSRAAAMAPSKMGFKPGTEITIDNALKIIMVKSANDVAVTLAEGVGGSVESFADMMNAYAQRLGMRESFFVNPNGLPDDRNRTSARDLAILGRALLTEFPQQQPLFGIGAIQFGRRVMKNTNGLIGRYPGADGMKTGFICSSGFNVVATATRGGRRLLVVVLGSYSAAERTIKAANLFDKGFSGFGWSSGGTLEGLPASFASAPPNMRDEVCGGKRPPVGEEEAEASQSPPVAASAGGNSENMAFELFSRPSPGAASVRASSGHGKLGPRANFVPVPVFIGRTPGSTAVAKAKGKDAGKPASASAFAPSEPSPGIAAGAPAELQAIPAGDAATGKPKAAAKTKPAATAAKSKVDPKGKLTAASGNAGSGKSDAAHSKGKAATKTQASAAAKPKPASAKPAAKPADKPADKAPAADTPAPGGDPAPATTPNPSE